MEAASGDYGFIIRVLQHLDLHHHVRFFIGSRDFDILYRWWEKRIPEALVREALDRVVERRRRLGKPLDRMSVFSGEVRRRYQSFLTLAVGRQREEPGEEPDAFAAFLASFPPALEFLRGDVEAYARERRQGSAPDPEPLREKLLARFRDDGELNAKAAWFLRNLAPPLRRPEIERTYRLNFLLGKFGIPALD
jgi:hypothetical protein